MPSFIEFFKDSPLSNPALQFPTPLGDLVYMLATGITMVLSAINP